MNAITEAVVTIATAIVGIAILAVLVSNRSNTSGVITSAGNAFAKSIGAATGPVTGGGGFQMPNTSFGLSGGYM